jgi:hypothetical protein
MTTQLCRSEDGVTPDTRKAHGTHVVPGMRGRHWVTALLCVTVLIVPGLAAGQWRESEGWQFGAEAYLCGASLDMEFPDGSNGEIRFTDIVEDLGFAFMGVLAARRNKLTLMSDVLYLDVDDDISEDQDEGISLANVGIKSWVVTPLAAYQVLETERLTVNLVAGARYLWIEVPAEFEFSDPLPPGNAKISPSASTWDGVAGLRGQWQFNDKWHAIYHADVGTGDSDYTWQGLAGVGYHFEKFDAVLAYRYLTWTFDDEGAPLRELTISGVMAGMRFYF